MSTPLSSDALSDRLDFAVAIARAGGDAALRHFQTRLTAETKADASPVTLADRAAERTLRERIEERFPDDGVIGEEEGEARAGAPLRWILDPIDGTRTYLRGVPLFGVLVALEHQSSVALGVIHMPALGETVYAARGLGCWWNGRRAHVSRTVSLANALVLTTDPENITGTRAAGWDRLRSSAGLWRTWGDCYGYVLVATGRAEAMLDPLMAVWDAAALVPIIEEAGGVFSGWEGGSGHRLGSAVATNATLAADIRAMLAGER